LHYPELHGGLIETCDVEPSGLIPSNVAAPIIGQTIEDVLVCDYWPSFGLLMASGYCAHADSDGDTYGLVVEHLTQGELHTDCKRFGI